MTSGGAVVADVLVIGAGPAGLSAALNLVRARRTVVVVDSNRPRNAATLASHGFITRDGISPLELRRLGREEIEGYDEGSVRTAMVLGVERASDRFTVSTRGLRGTSDAVIDAGVVIVATGLAEALPAVADLRAYYGTQLHSCVECDAYGKSDQRLVLIGETGDLAERARELAHWTPHLTVLTNGSDAVTPAENADLVARGIEVDRRPVVRIAGERGTMTGYVVDDGGSEQTIHADGGFVRPVWSASLGYLGTVTPELDEDGLIVVDAEGRTSIPGLYAVGDCTPPGPRQLIVAAGAAAVTARAVNRDLIGLPSVPVGPGTGLEHASPVG